MSKTKKKKWKERDWLNPIGEDSAARYMAGVTSRTNPNYPGADAYLNLSDCNRTIFLEFDFHSRKTFARRIAKLDKLVGVLSRLRASLIAAEKATDWEKAKEVRRKWKAEKDGIKEALG